MKNCLFVLLISLGGSMGFLSAQTINKTLDLDGQTREYTVFLPQTYDPLTDSLPLIINMHGLGSDAFQQMLYSNFNTIADTGNFIVVYPQGLTANIGGNIQTHWNANFGSGVDDVGFINRLIDQMFTDYGIDLARVYATGMSNGGYMSYHLACQLSDRIAAIASVTGAMTFPDIANCAIDRNLPVMQIHGTVDDVVPITGTPIVNPAISEVVNFWLQHNNCTADPDTLPIEDIFTFDNASATLFAYETCDSGSAVHYYLVDNGGHTWPGALPIPDLGNTCLDFSASVKIWEFFNRFTHPNPRPGTIISSKDAVQDLAWGKTYPNPTTSTLKIDLEIATESVQLLDARGQALRSIQSLSPGSTVSWELADLPAGMYLLRVKTEQGQVTQKIMKQ
ncbi:MAG: T9SS type A sorting domain-containing protein [Bacteroidota bacterium]